MKKYLSGLIKNHYKTIFKSLNASSSKIATINNLELKLSKNCKIGKKNELIYLSPDEIITPYILKNGYWDYEKIKFIKKYSPKQNKIFFDIGANIGLITKQLINLNINFKKFFCFEPDTNSFECLKKNICKSKIVNVYNYGLSNKQMSLKLYKNKFNSGDSSFVKKSSHYEISKTKPINHFFNKNKKEIIKSNIIYKSDTQGMDEIIFLNIHEKYFKKITIAIIEINNHQYLKKNLELFLKKIKKFKVHQNKNFQNLSIKQIISKIKNKEEFDLFMSK